MDLLTEKAYKKNITRFISLVEEDILEHGREEKELRREKKKKKWILMFFLYMGKKKKKKNKGAPSIVKLKILGFLFGCFTDE